MSKGERRDLASSPPESAKSAQCPHPAFSHLRLPAPPSSFHLKCRSLERVILDGTDQGGTLRAIRLDHLGSLGLHPSDGLAVQLGVALPRTLGRLARRVEDDLLDVRGEAPPSLIMHRNPDCLRDRRVSPGTARGSPGPPRARDTSATPAINRRPSLATRSSLRRAAGAVMLTAATAYPVKSRTGAARQRMPRVCSSRSTANPARRTSSR